MRVLALPVLAVVPMMQSAAEKRWAFKKRVLDRARLLDHRHRVASAWSPTPFSTEPLRMYERFFSLRERPFDLTPNPRFLVMTDGHREALSNLEYAIAARKGITLLLGEAGCGKTTDHSGGHRAAAVARALCPHHQPGADPRRIRGDAGDRVSSLSRDGPQSKATLLRELESLLRQRREADETTVLVIDEAQSLLQSCSRRSGCSPTSRRQTTSS